MGGNADVKHMTVAVVSDVRRGKTRGFSYNFLFLGARGGLRDPFDD